MTRKRSGEGKEALRNILMSEVIHLKNILLSHTQKMANKLWLLNVLKDKHCYFQFCSLLSPVFGVVPHCLRFSFPPGPSILRDGENPLRRTQERDQFSMHLVYYSIQLPSFGIIEKALYD